MSASKQLIDHRETSDFYQAEIFRRGSFRVIICSHCIQWILQRQRPSGAKWIALGYYRTRKALQRLWTGLHGQPAPEIEALPRRFPMVSRERTLLTHSCRGEDMCNG